MPGRQDPVEPRMVSIRRGEVLLRGWLYARPGAGPVPAILWHHGSERGPDHVPRLGQFYVASGYTLLVLHRHGHGLSPGEYPLDVIRAQARTRAATPEDYRGEAIALLIDLHRRYLLDTVAALEWLARLPYVDADRIAITGVSHGGVQTVLAAQADVGAKAYVAFAPAAMAWSTTPELHELLLDAVRAARAPIFLLQAANDYSLGPSEVLGRELERKGPPNRARVYPAYGRTQQSGHGDFACLGTAAWGDDVCAFLDQVLGPGPSAATATLPRQ